MIKYLTKKALPSLGITGIVLFIFFVGFTPAVYAQNISVKGSVYDAQTSDPLPGVDIIVKGTRIGVATKTNGKFHLSVPSLQDTLVFSYVGYKKRYIPIKGRIKLHIGMHPTAISGQKLVVVGYGSEKKKNLTGSVVTANMKQMQNLPVSNLTAALSGSDLLPGVHIIGGQSRPGEPGRIIVRNPPEGAKNGGSQGPLYVIDGVVRTQQDFNLLDPSQIASISIVKDATAAIYGARAAQGVVIVTTKQGKIGKPHISFSSSGGVSGATYIPKMMNGYQLATYLNDMHYTQGQLPSNSDIYTPDELAYFKKYNYNWFNMAWKPSETTHQALSISGGSHKATYYAGASYYYGNGNVNKIHYQKWNLQASTNIHLTNDIDAGLNLSGVISNRKWFFLKQGGENPSRDVTNLLQTPQFIPPYVNGYPVELPAGVNRGQGLHFFAIQNLDNFTTSNTNELNVNAHLEYDAPFLQGLKVKVVYNRNMNNFWGKQYGTYYNLYQFSMKGEHKHIYAGTPIKEVQAQNGDRIRINPAYTKAYQLDANVSYDHQFGKNHISILALMEQSQSYYETTAAMAQDIAVDIPYMLSALGTQTATNSANEAGTLSYAGRVNYNYNDTYIAEFDWRYDSSTKFAPKYRWGFFPAFSAAWIISNENFLKHSKVINFLKLRGSAGRLGRDRTNAWEWFQRYTLQQGHGAVFGNNNDRTLGIKLEHLPNAMVTWDDINEYDVGLDATTLNNRLYISMDGYFNHGYHLLTNLTASAPFTIGSQMPAENYDITNSFGYELSLQWRGKIGPNFRYSITTGLNYENSYIVKYDVAPGNVGTWQDLTGTFTRNQGVEGFVYEGMFRTQQQVNAYLKQHPGYTIFGQTPEPGMLYYKDIRGPKLANGKYAPPDGKITSADMTYIHPNRGINKGVSFTVSWKGLRAHVKTSFGVATQQFVPGEAIKQASVKENKPAFWANHWTPKNTNAAYPDPYYQQDWGVMSSFWIRNANYFDISLISLSYELPHYMLNNLGISGLRFYLTATNPLMIQNNQDLLSYQLSYPVLKTVSLGINLNL